MTNIDHDALARRIADDIMTACRGGPEERAIRLDLIGLNGRRLGAWAIDALARRIAEHLREALPTSDPDACEHAVKEGDWCEECNRDYKCAAAEDDES